VSERLTYERRERERERERESESGGVGVNKLFVVCRV